MFYSPFGCGDHSNLIIRSAPDRQLSSFPAAGLSNLERWHEALNLSRGAYFCRPSLFIKLPVADWPSVMLNTLFHTAPGSWLASIGFQMPVLR